MRLFLRAAKNILYSSRNISYQKLKTWYGGLVRPQPPDPPYKHVTQIGDPVLRTVSDAVPKDALNSAEIKFLIKQMSKVFEDYKCIGLSAVQIGMPLRVFMFELSKSHMKNYSEAEIKNCEICFVPRTVVINPEIKVVDYTKTVFPEACMSVKGFFGDVPRFKSVKLTGFNENGDPLIVEAEGWTARIIQHEMDHLDGKLYTDIMERKSFTCGCWQAVNERSGKILLPYGPD